MHKRLTALLSALAVLAACAPVSTAPGASAFSPLDARASARIGTGTTYVKAAAFEADVSLPVFDRTFTQFYGYNDIQVGYSRTTSADWYALASANAPAGWRVELARQNTTTRVTGVRLGDNQTKYYTTVETVEPVFAVTVPDSAPEGAVTVTATLTSSVVGPSTRPVRFTVNVAKNPAN